MCGRQQTDRARQSCCRCSLLDLLYSLCVIWVWGVTVTERERERERGGKKRYHCRKPMRALTTRLAKSSLRWSELIITYG